MPFRISTYYTLKGIVQTIDLPDSVYGEWVLYDKGMPKFHVNLFDDIHEANARICTLIDSKEETIETLIHKINEKHNVKLSLRSKSMLRILKSSEIADWHNQPLPMSWLLNLNT